MSIDRGRGKLIGAESALVLASHEFRKPLLCRARATPPDPRYTASTTVNMAQNDAVKRAETGMTIAKFKFKQALKKDDSSESRLPPVAIELSAQFLSDLDAVSKQSTPANVQVSEHTTIDHFSPGTD